MKLLNPSNNQAKAKLRSTVLYFSGFICMIGILKYVARISFANLHLLMSGSDLNAIYFYYSDRLIFGAHNQHFGFPLGVNASDVPYMASFNDILVHIDYALTHNLFFSVNLILIWSIFFNYSFAFALAKKMILGDFFTLVFSLAVALLPWNFYRYYHIDFLVFMSVLIPLFLFKETKTFTNFHIFLWTVLGIFIGLQNLYYVGFGLIVFFAVLIAKKNLIRSDLSLLTGIIIGFILNFGYSTDFTFKVANVFVRSLNDSLIYGGQPYLLFSPLPTSPIFQFLGLPSISTVLPPQTEADSLSNYGSFLTLFSLFIILMYLLTFSSRLSNYWDRSARTLITGLLVVWVICFAFFTRGFFGLIFSGLITRQIRSWNRFAPILEALLILISLIIALEFLKQKRSQFWKFGFLLVVIILLCDQTASLTRLTIFEGGARIDSLQTESNKIDKVLVKKNCGILQLPYVAYPESPPINTLLDYEHLDISLVNRSHSWSYGGLRSSAQDSLYQKLSQEVGNVSTQLKLRKLGFCGIAQDLRAYTDDAFSKQLDKIYGTGTTVNNYRIYRI